MNGYDPTTNKTLSYKERGMRFGGSTRIVNRGENGGQNTIPHAYILKFQFNEYRMMQESQAATSSGISASNCAHARYIEDKHKEMLQS